MRIISKFRDYYDSVQAHGVDLSLVYLRKVTRYGVNEGDTLRKIYTDLTAQGELHGEVDVETPGMDLFWEPQENCWRAELEGREDSFHFSVNILVVGVCGKIRPCLRFRYGNKARYSCSLDDFDATVDFAYNVQQADKIVDKFPKRLRTLYYAKLSKKEQRKRKHRKDGDIYELHREEFEAFFNKRLPRDDSRLFQHFKSPIITLRRMDGPYGRGCLALHVNDALRKVGYMKVADPYEVYQEISQYIGGVLGVGEPDTLEISDEDMRDEKGFFDMSFKTDPGTKKPIKRGKKKKR